MPSQQKSIEEMILSYLGKEGKSVKWLANELMLNQSHLTRVLRPPNKEKRPLSAGLKKRIEEVLGKEFNPATSTSAE